MSVDKKKIQVLIIDDHRLVIDGVRALLRDEPEIEVSGWANSGREGLQEMTKKSFDVVLLDVSMPEMDGLKTCELLLKQHPDTKVIALTMLGERSMIKAMVEAGASGYLLKNVDQAELVLAIQRVFAGKSHFSKEIAEILLVPQIDKGVSFNSPPQLSSREKQILKLILDELTTAEISESLSISTNTVETHRRNIMHKLGAKNLAGVVRIAIESGLV